MVLNTLSQFVQQSDVADAARPIKPLRSRRSLDFSGNAYVWFNKLKVRNQGKNDNIFEGKTVEAPE